MTKDRAAQKEIIFTQGYIVSVPPKTEAHKRALISKQGRKGSYHQFDVYDVNRGRVDGASHALSAWERVTKKSWKNHDTSKPQAQRLVSILKPVAFKREELRHIQSSVAAQADLSRQFGKQIPPFLAGTVAQLTNLQVDFELAANNTYEAHLETGYACMTVDDQGACVRLLVVDRTCKPSAPKHVWVSVDDYNSHLYGVAEFRHDEIVGKALELEELEDGEAFGVSKLFVGLERQLIPKTELDKQAEVEGKPGIEEVQRASLAKLLPDTVQFLRGIDPNLPTL